MSSSNGRNHRGRFAPGNPGGPGNPAWGNLRLLKQVVAESTSKEELTEVWTKCIELAKSGNLPAIKYVMDRVMGKPKETVELEGDSLNVLVGSMKEGIRRLEDRVGDQVSFE